MIKFKHDFRLMGFGVLAFLLFSSNAPGTSAAQQSRDTGQTELAVTEGCPKGWVSSSAPGGCSPGSFTLKQRRVYQAQYHCAFGVECDLMVDAILALGGTCASDGPDTTCDLPPLIED